MLKTLLQGHPDRLRRVIEQPRWSEIGLCLAITVVGSALYGVTVGIWRAPLQSFYTAIKFPLLILLTSAANGLINGMLAQILGSGFSFKQTTLAILISFAIAATILGSLAPITLFICYNAPPLQSTTAVIGHSVMLLTHVSVIAFAGTVANRRLYHLVHAVSGRAEVARKVLIAWLAGNLFLGAQLAWNLRPFIGSPTLGVQFLRPDPLRGNFYEAVWRALHHLIF